MEIGDIVVETPFVDSMDGIPHAHRGPRKAVVVYIHPNERFYRVEFTAENGVKWRECFYFPERRGNPNASKSLEPVREKHVGFHKTCRKGALYS